MKLILVLLKNSLDDCLIILKYCLVATHVLISFVTVISTIVWKIWLETDKVMVLSWNLMMTHHYLVSIMIPSWTTMTEKWLNLYCADKFQFYQEDAQSFNVTKGESVLSNSATLYKSISINTAEEADQKLVCHIIHCVRSGVKQWVVRTVYTDVAISLIAYRRLVENFDCVVLSVWAVQSQTGSTTSTKLLKNLARENVELSHSFMRWQGAIFYLIL